MECVKIRLKCTLNGFIELRRGQMTDSWEHCNDLLGCIRSKAFLLPAEQSYLVMKASAPWSCHFLIL